MKDGFFALFSGEFVHVGHSCKGIGVFTEDGIFHFEVSTVDGSAPTICNAAHFVSHTSVTYVFGSIGVSEQCGRWSVMGEKNIKHEKKVMEIDK